MYHTKKWATDSIFYCLKMLAHVHRINHVCKCLHPENDLYQKPHNRDTFVHVNVGMHRQLINTGKKMDFCSVTCLVASQNTLGRYSYVYPEQLPNIHVLTQDHFCTFASAPSPTYFEIFMTICNKIRVVYLFLSWNIIFLLLFSGLSVCNFTW